MHPKMPRKPTGKLTTNRSYALVPSKPVQYHQQENPATALPASQCCANGNLWLSTLEYFNALPLKERPVATFNYFYCLCGKRFETKKDRDTHVAQVQPEGTHGAFFDELPHTGGAYVLVNRKQVTVERTENFRLRIPFHHDVHSTWGEALTAHIARTMSTLDITGSTLPPGTSTLTVTDNQAAKDIIKNLGETQPTLAHEHRCNLGHITAAERNLMQIAKE